MADETAVAEETQDDAQAATDAQTTEDATGTNGGNDEQKFSQAEVERMIADRLERERAKAEKDRKKADEAAEAKRLEEQQEWQQLADQRAERVAELEPAAEKAERYEAALKGYLDAEREGLPAHIVTLLDRMDVDEQLQYITANRETLKPQTQRSGVPDTPRSNSNGMSRDELIAQEIAAQRTGRGRPY